MHAQDLSTITERTNDGLRVLGLRFTSDRGCPPERFETLRTTLGASFEGIEIDSSPGNAAGIAPSAHAVLTVSLVDEPGHPTRVALDRVLAFLAEQLRPERRRGVRANPSRAGSSDRSTTVHLPGVRVPCPGHQSSSGITWVSSVS